MRGKFRNLFDNLIFIVYYVNTIKARETKNLPLNTRLFLWGIETSIMSFEF